MSVAKKKDWFIKGIFTFFCGWGGPHTENHVVNLDQWKMNCMLCHLLKTSWLSALLERLTHGLNSVNYAESRAILNQTIIVGFSLLWNKTKNKYDVMTNVWRPDKRKAHRKEEKDMGLEIYIFVVFLAHWHLYWSYNAKHKFCVWESEDKTSDCSCPNLHRENVWAKDESFLCSFGEKMIE